MMMMMMMMMMMLVVMVIMQMVSIFHISWLNSKKAYLLPMNPIYHFSKDIILLLYYFLNIIICLIYVKILK